MFPLGQNIPDWVFVWNTSLLCWRKMGSMWSFRIRPLSMACSCFTSSLVAAA